MSRLSFFIRHPYGSTWTYHHGDDASKETQSRIDVGHVLRVTSIEERVIGLFEYFHKGNVRHDSGRETERPGQDTARRELDECRKKDDTGTDGSGGTGANDQTKGDGHIGIV